MAVTFERECDPGQGFNFKQDEHFTFGYITTLTIGDTEIDPSFKVFDPSDMPDPPKKASATGGGEDSVGASQSFKKPVVAVLTKLAWGTQTTDHIDFEGRIAPKNMQLINTLLMSNLKKLVVEISFTVFEYDNVNNAYFPVIASFKGSQPIGMKPASAKGGGFKTDSKAKPVYGLLARDSNTLKLTATTTPESEPAGFFNHAFTISVAATSAPAVQEIQIQTSTTNKLIKPWGLPQQ